MLVFLAAAGVVVPLFQRLRISPVLGFLAAGVVLGPHLLGRVAESTPWLSVLTLSDPQEMRVFAEFGVVFLLFMIGLELSWERLRTLRKLVFGLGLAQVVVCAALLAGAAMLAGQEPEAAVVAGAALALSSTALVVPMLSERKMLHAPVGRTTFSVLLAQDLSVGPILIMVTVLAGLTAGGSAQAWPQALLSLATAAMAIAGLVVAGRVLLRPMLRSVARSQSRELFLAASLLVVIGAGIAASLSGLSMALGAFIAGLLLAETEFRREVEVTIEPFKGLLIGLFFVSVGASLDLAEVARAPGAVLGLVGLAFGLKAIAILVLARLFGLPARTAVEAALMLGPAGEFAFVIVDTALHNRLLDPTFAQAILVSATVSMFAVPFMASFAGRVGERLESRDAGAPDPQDVDSPAGNRVLIVGFGRVGRLVADMLDRHEIDYVGIDSDPVLVKAERDKGRKIFFGDAARTDFLKKCGVETVPAMVVTMDAPLKVEEVVRTARAVRKDLPIVARARDEKHAAKLYRMGATDAVPENVEASLQLAENTLVDLGVPMGLVLASIHEKRDEYRKLFQDSVSDSRPTRGVRARAADMDRL